MTGTGSQEPLTLAERLGAAVDYLEARLAGEVDLDEAARRARFSRWHFMRLFQAASGLPVAEYVRRRRLSRAADALRRGERVLEVALEAGYESQAAFTRAFSRTFGATPARFARAGQSSVAQVGPFEPRVPFALPGPPAPPRIVDKPGLRLIGLSTRARRARFETFASIPAFWREWLTRERWREIRGALPGRPAYGLARCDGDGWLDYVIALEVGPSARPPRGYCAFEVPAGPCALFEGRGEPSRTVQELTLAAYGHWLPTSGRRRCWDAWDVEAYFDEGGSGRELREEVWIPLAAVD